MKIKIMLLAIGAALLLTACGQVERSSTETSIAANTGGAGRSMATTGDT